MSIRTKIGTIPVGLFLIFPISQLMICLGNLEVIMETGLTGWIGILSGLLADVILLFVLRQGTMKEQLEKELLEARHLKELKQNYHHMIQKRGEELAQIKEEYEQQLQKACEMIDEGKPYEAQDILNEVQKGLKKTEAVRFCSNRTVNAVLSEKQEDCKKLDFAIQTDIQIMEGIPIEPLHLCSSFSNLLDNAIAASRMIEKDRREVSVRTEYKGNYLFIKVSNAADEIYVKREVKTGHGFGKQILNDIAEKYDGKYTDHYESGQFTAMLMLKLDGGRTWD